jgi:hypothetical protein
MKTTSPSATATCRQRGGMTGTVTIILDGTTSLLHVVGRGSLTSASFLTAKEFHICRRHRHRCRRRHCRREPLPPPLHLPPLPAGIRLIVIPVVPVVVSVIKVVAATTAAAAVIAVITAIVVAAVIAATAATTEIMPPLSLLSSSSSLPPLSPLPPPPPPQPSSPLLLPSLPPSSSLPSSLSCHHCQSFPQRHPHHCRLRRLRCCCHHRTFS